MSLQKASSDKCTRISRKWFPIQKFSSIDDKTANHFMANGKPPPTKCSDIWNLVHCINGKSNFKMNINFECPCGTCAILAKSSCFLPFVGVIVPCMTIFVSPSNDIIYFTSPMQQEMKDATV